MGQFVMVALDGTDKDPRAIAVGLAIAKLAGAKLDLVRILGRAPTDVLALAAASGLLGIAEGERDVVESQLAAVAADIAAVSGETPSYAALVAIDVPLALIQHAAERDALAIVLATRAPTALSRVFLGSVADRVVRESVRPVIVVPPGAAHLGDNHMTIKRVLVPLDGSSLALRSLEYLIQLPQAVTLEYILVEVVPSADLRGAAEDRLRTTATWLRSRGPQSVEEVVLESNDPGRAIVDAVREVLPEIIAMSSRGNGGLGRLMLGSVAEAVVHGSELPVLVLTPKALA